MFIAKTLEWLVTGGVVAALVGAIIKAMVDLYKWSRRNQKLFSKQFRRRVRIYEAMNRILQQTNAKRVLILKTENGGGIPRLGSRIYASIIYEDFEAPFKSVINKYGPRFPLDQEYIKVLQHIATAEDGRIVLNTEEMTYGILKTIYEEEGVAFSEIFYLNQSRTAFYYINIATDNEGAGEMTTDPQQLIIKTQIEKLKEIFKKEK